MGGLIKRNREKIIMAGGCVLIGLIVVLASFGLVEIVSAPRHDPQAPPMQFFSIHDAHGNEVARITGRIEEVRR